MVSAGSGQAPRHHQSRQESPHTFQFHLAFVTIYDTIFDTVYGDISHAQRQPLLANVCPRLICHLFPLPAVMVSAGMYIPAWKSHVSMKIDPLVHRDRSALSKERATGIDIQEVKKIFSYCARIDAKTQRRQARKGHNEWGRNKRHHSWYSGLYTQEPGFWFTIKCIRSNYVKITGKKGALCSETSISPYRIWRRAFRWRFPGRFIR